MQEFPQHSVLFLGHGRRGSRSPHGKASRFSNMTSWIIPSSLKLGKVRHDIEDLGLKTSDNERHKSIASMNEQNAFSFNNLPTDVVEVIFQWAISMSQSTGAVLCRVSRSVFELAAPILYYAVFLVDNEAWSYFLATISAKTRGVSYSAFVRELYIPKDSDFSGRVKMPNLRSLSIPHFSYINRFEDLSRCQYLALRSRKAVFEELPSRAVLSSLTHITLPPRWNMRGIVLSPTITPLLTHLALPISIGTGISRHLVIQDQRHFLNVTNSKFKLKKIILLPWKTSKGEIIGEVVVRKALLEELGVDVEDTRYIVISHHFGDESVQEMHDQAGIWTRIVDIEC
ncbi:hypothetical protein M422DRAFT_69194 [Sphaerobolus stellatus SS14]|uniref:Uncharacterized protein n=1 Tax=Sphaerobolus stellatus (strain SS14) TaxID=990650 RepID=A0A0C9USQ0_SPHS4|nr:hypothetical protein M422DRAFT_69194 [Sphaerobolus stellatus SS14]